MKNSIQILFVVTLLFLFKFSEAQTNKAIYVFDAGSNSAIDQVTVKTDNGIEVNTDQTGKCSLNLDGVSKIYLRKDGYINLDINATKGVKSKYYLFLDGEKFQRDYKGTLWAQSQEMYVDPSVLSFDLQSKGKIAGVLIESHSGMPGEGADVMIRGFRSLSLSNRPLLVVDGQIYQNQGYESPAFEGFFNNPSNILNPNDIETIEYIKDGMTSQYGSLGSNGVILVTTKRSGKLKTSVDASVWTGINKIRKELPLLNNAEWTNKSLEVLQTGLSMNDIYSYYPGLFNDPDDVGYHEYKYNTNWQDEIYRESLTQNYNVQVKGGDNVARYYLSIGYNGEGGIIENTNYSRYSTRFNTDVDVTNKLKVQLNLGVNYNNGELIDAGVSNNNPIYAAILKSPILQPKKVNYKGEEMPDYDPFHIFQISNPMAILNDNESEFLGYSLLGNFKFDYQITNSLAFSGAIGLTSWQDKQHSFISGVTNGAIVPTYVYNDYALNQVKHFVARNNSLHSELNLKYSKKYERSLLKLLLGGRYLSNDHETSYSFGMNTSSDKFITLDQVDRNDYREILSDFYDHKVISSYLSAEYLLDDCFEVSGTLNLESNNGHADDGAENYLYGNVGVSYNFAKCGALQSSNLIDVLRLRGSYGLSGNSRLDASMVNKLYQTKTFSNVTGLVRKNIYNSKLENEKVNTLNAGFDFITTRNNFSLTADVWHSTTKDMIIYNQTVNHVGFDGVYSNNGEMSAHGFDVTVDGKLTMGEFNLKLGANISKSETSIDQLGDANELVSSFNGGDMIVKKGTSGYQFYGLQMDGVFASQTEAEQS